MTTKYVFESEKFKPIISAYLNAGCNFSEMPPALKKPIRVTVNENIMNIWLSDGFHYIEAHFTKDAINEFRKNHTTLKFSALRDKILVVTRWRLIHKYEDSKECFTSYQNFTTQLIVEQFRPLQFEKATSRQIAESKNLFRDPEIQGLIRNKRHEETQRTILEKHLYFRSDFTVPSVKDIFSSESTFQLKKLPHTNIEYDQLMLSDDDDSTYKDMLALRQAEKELIDSYNTDILSHISTQVSTGEILRCQLTPLTKELLENDQDDFEEFKDIFNSKTVASGDMEMIDTTTNSSRPSDQYYDVKKLIIMERGEEEYEFLYDRKKLQMKGIIEDENFRQIEQLNLDHFYGTKEKSRLEFQRELTIKRQLKEEQQRLKKKQKKVIRYKIGFSANDIKQKVLRFMTTFNPQNANSNNDESILEMREEQTVEPRPRSFSQENIHRNDHSELFETKTVVSHYGGGYALSQYICQQSVFNRDDDDDVTQSENEDDYDDPMINESKKKLKQVLGEVKPTISLYKRYIQWFAQHDVMSKSRYEMVQEQMKQAAEAEAARIEAERIEQERQEQLARELEQRRIEAEQYRQQQAELDRQRKLEKQQAKQKLLEEEKLRKQQEFEDQERERQLLLQRERERQEQELLHQQALERQRLQAEEDAREQQRLREEEQARLKQLKLAQQEKERQEREEQDKREQELRRQKMQEEKDKLRREYLQQKQKDEERRLRKEQQRAQQIAAAEEMERQFFLKKKQEEEEQAALQAAQAEMLRQKAIAEQAERERIIAEQERLRQEAIRKAEQERAEAEIRKQKELERLRLIQEEEMRKAQEKARILEEQRLLREENERKEAFERQRVEEERKIAQQQIELQRQLEIQRQLLEQQRLQAIERARLQSMVQSQQQLNLDDNSSCTSSELDENTPAFVQDPSDMEQSNINNVPFNTQYSNRQSLQESPYFLEKTSSSVNYEQSQTLAHLINFNEGSEVNGPTTVLSRKTDSNSKSQKRHHRKHSSSSEDEEDHSSSIPSSQQQSNESESSSQDSNSSDNSESSSSDSDVDSETLVQLAKMLAKSKKSKKDKKGSKRKDKVQTKLLASMLKVFASSGKTKSNKKHSSGSKKHSSKHHNASSDKKSTQSQRLSTSAFSVDEHSLRQLAPSPQQFKERQSPQEPQSLRLAPQHLQQPQVVQQSFELKQQQPPAMASSNMTSFDAWKMNLISSAQNPNVVPKVVNLMNSENIPQNGQFRQGSSGQAVQMQSHKARMQAEQETMNELEQIQFYTKLNGAMKRPKHK